MERYYPAIYELARPASLKTDEEKPRSIKWCIIQINTYPATASYGKGFMGYIYLKMKKLIIKVRFIG